MADSQKVAVTKNGKTYYLNANNTAVFGHYLFADGKTYHKYLDCYKLWSEEYQTNFTGWQAISKKEIKEMHLRYCKFCQNREDDETQSTHYEFLPTDAAEKKPVPKWLKIFLFVALALLLIVVIGVHFLPDPSEDETTTSTPTAANQVVAVSDNSEQKPVVDFHLYDQARDIPVIDTETSERKGTYSLIKTDSALVTDELLVDWYENHVSLPGRGFSLIVFVDKDEKEGIYALSGMIAKNVHLESDPDDPYLYDVDFDDAVYYSVIDGNLVEQPFTITD